MQTSIISIQSQVVHGHVGNSAAILPMQARGLNVAAVPTTLLSNHPGFETMHAKVLTIAAGDNVTHILPPLIVTDGEIHLFIERLDQTLAWLSKPAT